MHVDHSTNQAGIIQRTWFSILPRRPVTFFVLMAVAATLFIFLDSYTETNVITFFIPNFKLNANSSTIVNHEEYLDINTLENTTTIISSPTPTSAKSLPSSFSLPSSLTSSVPNSAPSSAPSSVPSSAPTFVPTSPSKLSTSVSLVPVQQNVTNVKCHPTMYVDCYYDTSKKILTNETFNIALIRKPGWLSLETFDLKQCLYSNCKYQGGTIDNTTHLVIIYVVGLNDNFRLPQRFPGQLYAAAAWESPVHTHASFLYDNNSYWNSAFNVTATYRTDSDIFSPYARLKYQPKEQLPDYYEIAKNKSKSVAWFVSNCGAPSRRHDYVKQMQKIIDVDIYGGCGQPCAPSISFCHEDIPIKYRFYLSFENSLCTGYTTEKLFKIYAPNTHIIPVVRGALDYNKYIPNNTFINAADFKSAADLAQFLKKLGDDPRTYSTYLEQKDQYEILNPAGFNLGCAACTFLNTKKTTAQVYNMKSWMGDNQCRPPTDL